MDMRIALVLLMFLGVAGCSSVNVSSDYNKDFNFADLKNYDWHMSSTAKVGDESIEGHPLLDELVQTAVEKNLAVKGYSKNSQSVDFYINYSVTTENELDITTFNTYGGFPSNWGWRNGYGRMGLSPMPRQEVFITTYRKGTLVIDVIDPVTSQLVWRGIGRKTIPDQYTTPKLTADVNEIVESVLGDFTVDPQ